MQTTLFRARVAAPARTRAGRTAVVSVRAALSRPHGGDALLHPIDPKGTANKVRRALLLGAASWLVLPAGPFKLGRARAAEAPPAAAEAPPAYKKLKGRLI